MAKAKIIKVVMGIQFQVTKMEAETLVDICEAVLSKEKVHLNKDQTTVAREIQGLIFDLLLQSSECEPDEDYP